MYVYIPSTYNHDTLARNDCLTDVKNWSHRDNLSSKHFFKYENERKRVEIIHGNKINYFNTFG